MLVLTRATNELFVIGDQDGNELARVMVVKIIDQRVRLGVEADRKYAVHRLEVWDAIQREKRAVASHPIQASEADVADLGRVIDPLGVAEAYDEGRAS